MPDELVFTVDKFTIRVATDRFYTPEGLWCLPEGGAVRIGISDYLQLTSGDVTFAEIRPAGTAVPAGGEIASIETIKVSLSLVLPMPAEVLEVNPSLLPNPEHLNQDPYGKGWIARVRIGDWEGAKNQLLSPEAYFDRAEKEARRA